MSTSSSKHNLAARMAVWSGRHRKKAFWGWLAFVLVVFMAGNMIGTTSISDVDQFSGESHRAEVALQDAGMRPVKEVVFIQSDKLTVKDPAFRAAVVDVTGRLSRLQYVRAVTSPLMNMPAIATITVTPEISTARPDVAAAVSSAERWLRPAARPSRSRRR